jgi:glycosyltransferase involved in cell wall biosynthesis
MYIGIDGTFLQPESLYTGMGTYTLGLVKALASLVEEDEIVLIGYSPRPELTPAGVRWEVIPRLLTGRWGVWLNHQIFLPRLVRKLNLDVFHIPGVNMRLSRPGIPFYTPCPIVVTIHDMIPLVYYGRKGPPLPWRLRLGYLLAMQTSKRAAAVITVSESSRKDILTHLPALSDRIHVIHNGLDIPPLEDEEGQKVILDRLGVRSPYLLYAGSYEPRKNLIGAVMAYREALEHRQLPEFVLLVERESGHREETLREIDKSGISSRLHFVHSLTENELATLYRGATLLLYPSHYEGFGFPPLLGLACGIPVIASDKGSLPEVLGEVVFYVDPESAGDMAHAIIELLDHPERANKLASDGPGQAAKYRWQDAAQSTYQVYEKATQFVAPAVEQE